MDFVGHPARPALRNRSALKLGVNKGAIIMHATEQCHVMANAVSRNGIRYRFIEVEFVDANGGRNPEVFGQLHYAIHVVNTG